MDQTRTDKMASTSKEKDRDTHAANGGINKLQKFEKENTVQIDLEGEEKISTLELMKNLKILCGGLLACRVLTEKKYEVTLSSAAGKRRLMDGFKIGTTNVIAKELINDELVVSFLGLPAYITDEEILGKLQGWGVSAVSAIRRRVWPGTQVADGTRFVKVKFTDTVQSLPYSTRFNTALGPEYFRVIHDKQVKVCRICIQPGHILRDCPEFLCHTCGVQGHYARECSAKKEKDKCQICHYTTKECKCNVSEHENKDEDLLKSTQNTLAQEENDMEEEYGDDTPGNMNVLDLMEPREEFTGDTVASQMGSETTSVGVSQLEAENEPLHDEVGMVERGVGGAPSPPSSSSSALMENMDRKMQYDISQDHLPSYQPTKTATLRKQIRSSDMDTDPDLDLSIFIRDRRKINTSAKKISKKKRNKDDD